MKKRQLTNNGNMKKKETTNKVTPKWRSDYFCIWSFKNKPIGEVGIHDLCNKLKAWALFDGDGTKQESLRIDDFLDEFGIASRDYYRLKKQWPILEEVHQFAIRRLASRREIGALKRRYDAGMVSKTLGAYCEIAKTEQERLARLKDNADTATSFHVYMDSFPIVDSNNSNK